jgi:hypothetical protein
VVIHGELALHRRLVKPATLGGVCPIDFGQRALHGESRIGTCGERGEEKCQILLHPI